MKNNSTESSGETIEDKSEKQVLEVSPEQLEQLESALELTKALASPIRLALVGALASRPATSLTVEELAEIAKVTEPRMERDLLQLVEASVIQVVAWKTTAPGREPVPAQVSFNPAYSKNLPQIITTLAQLTRQLKPEQQFAPLDERAKTIGRFLKDGRLVGWPVQVKRQLYLLEEIAKLIEPNVRYSELQIDAVLKNIYEYDHCTLRRYLVDYKFLKRENGIYWKELSTVV
ncbi:MAG TPA: DUF2087 domain-containing protein [Chloroflexia bacterium]|nr:DUF2087 domain-containing protein [Chloroflexia bacterium]